MDYVRAYKSMISLFFISQTKAVVTPVYTQLLLLKRDFLLVYSHDKQLCKWLEFKPQFFSKKIHP